MIRTASPVSPRVAHLLAATAAVAEPGDPDAAFGPGGVALHDSGDVVDLQDVDVRPNGSVRTVGFDASGSGLVLRLDGTPDATFGAGPTQVLARVIGDGAVSAEDREEGPAFALDVAPHPAGPTGTLTLHEGALGPGSHTFWIGSVHRGLYTAQAEGSGQSVSSALP